MKRLYKSLILWRILSVCYFVLIFLSILPIGLLLQMLLEWEPLFERGVIKTVVSLILSSMLIGCITLCFRAVLIKRSSHNTFRSPCRILLYKHKKIDSLSLLEKKLELKRIAENCWFGKESYKRSLRVFVFLFHGQSLHNDLSIAEQLVNEINKKTYFPSLIDHEMHQKMGRIQFFIYDEVPPKIMETAARSAADNIERSEFLVNAFISLNEGALYIPYCCSRLLGGGKLYQYAVTRIQKWLDL